MSAAARYRRLYTNDWHDPAFRQLNDAARVVRVYVDAGPQTTSVGCFRLSTAVAVEDLGGTAEAFEEHLETVCKAFEWAWNPVARVIWITNWFDRNPPANPNVVQSWAKLLRNVPDCDVRTQAFFSINHALKELPASFREPWRELSKLFPVGESRTEAIQGAGIRDQGSGIQRAGSLAENRKKPVGSEPTSQLVAVAHQMLQLTNPHAPIDELLDAFFETHRRMTNSKLPCPRLDAVNAIKIALSEPRASA